MQVFHSGSTCFSNLALRLSLVPFTINLNTEYAIISVRESERQNGAWDIFLLRILVCNTFVNITRRAPSRFEPLLDLTIEKALGIWMDWCYPSQGVLRNLRFCYMYWLCWWTLLDRSLIICWRKNFGKGVLSMYSFLCLSKCVCLYTGYRAHLMM